MDSIVPARICALRCRVAANRGSLLNGSAIIDAALFAPSAPPKFGCELNPNSNTRGSQECFTGRLVFLSFSAAVSRPAVTRYYAGRNSRPGSTL